MAKGKKTGGGSRKGKPNRASEEARLALARLIDRNAERMQGWLDEIAVERGAQAAWDSFVSVIEYHVPKLARNEMTGKDGKDLPFVWPIPKHPLEGE